MQNFGIEEAPAIVLLNHKKVSKQANQQRLYKRIISRHSYGIFLSVSAQGAATFTSKSVSVEELVNYDGDVKDKTELGKFLSQYVDKEAIAKTAAKKKAEAAAAASAESGAEGQKDKAQKGDKKGKSTGPQRPPGCKW